MVSMVRNSYLWLGALLAVSAAIFLGWKSLYYFSENRIITDFTFLDGEIETLFAKFDNNLDGALDKFEFQNAVKYLEGRKELEKEYQEDVKKSLLEKVIPEDEEFITVIAKMKPLIVNTMSKFSKDDQWDPQELETHTYDLKRWTDPYIPTANFSCKELEIFLPTGNAMSTGHMWDIIIPTLAKFGKTLPHNRVRPPIPETNKQEVILRLLSMFHPKPFVLTRFGPQGTIAIIRAINEEYYDIVYRIHAEFQLSDPPRYPFWFTPAQFAGRIIINKDGSHVRFFKMFVPTDKKLNVDMEWITAKRRVPEDEDVMEVDIGYLPEMAMESTGPSKTAGRNESEIEPISWLDEISEQDARGIIEQRFYPFKKVPYLPFNETFKKAMDEGKLVHSVLLWGSLDDQSC